MKIYGYSRNEEEKLLEIREISFQGSADELIEIANFILKYAKVMKENPDTFGHAHLKEEYVHWNDTQPDVIVCK